MNIALTILFFSICIMPVFAEEQTEAGVEAAKVSDEGYGENDAEYYEGESAGPSSAVNQEVILDQENMEQLGSLNDVVIPEDELAEPDYSSSALPDEEMPSMNAAAAGNAQTP